MREQTVSLTSATTSSIITLDRRGDAGDMYTVVLDFDSGTGVGTATLEFTTQNPNEGAPTIWLAHDVLVSKTASLSSNIIGPIQGVRLNVTAYTSGTITARVLQGGYHGN